MICDFIIDPVMGIRVLMGIELDDFQKYCIRTMHFTQNVMDCSGFSTGKSIRNWAYQNYRALIISNQWGGQYYQSFQVGKEVFWPYYSSVRHPIFLAQLGKVSIDGDEESKGSNKGPACWTQYFRNGSCVRMPAPDWGKDAKGQASYRFNFIAIDEWTKAETYGRADAGKAGGINQQILGRLTRENFCQDHPIWGNKLVLSATAEGMGHPAWPRYLAFKREVEKGNPNYAIISFTFKDWSNKRMANGATFRKTFRHNSRIKAMKDQFTAWHYLQEVLGIWSRSGKGWYREESIQACIDRGLLAKVEVLSNRHQSVDDIPLNPWYYFLGIDPAPAEGTRSDDGSLAVIRTRLKLGIFADLMASERRSVGASERELGRSDAPTLFSQHPHDWDIQPVYAHVLRKASAEQWSGKIHQLEADFLLSGMLMDPSGGGQWIRQVLNKIRQLIDGVSRDCTPIATLEDETALPTSQFTLNLFKRADVGITALFPDLRGDDNLVDAAHVVMQEAIERGDFQFPLPLDQRVKGSVRDAKEAWPVARYWAMVNLSQAVDQLLSIAVAMDAEGKLMLTRNNARQYSARGRKDTAYALIYATVRFLIWLKHAEINESFKPEDAGMCWVSK